MSVFKCCFGTKIEKIKTYRQAKKVEAVLGDISKSNKWIQLITMFDPNGQIVANVVPTVIDDKVYEDIMKKVVLFKSSWDSMAEKIGFDNSGEVYLKGKNSILLLTSIVEFTIAIYFEMNELKVEFFDWEHFISTLDDFVVNLHKLMTAED